VAERLAEFEAGGSQHQPSITLGYRAHFPEVEVKILAHGRDEAQASALAEEIAHQAFQRLSPYAYGTREDNYPAFVGAQLRARKLKLALAESCTGGLVAKLLTDMPGSSDFFQFSVVTYSNEAKCDLLGVDAKLIERYGAVSSEVAAAMAEGALVRSRSAGAAGADIAVAITGVAGPGGGSEAKPVGTVWFAVAHRGLAAAHTAHGSDQTATDKVTDKVTDPAGPNDRLVTRTERRFWPGARDAVRTWAAYCALQLLLQSLGATRDGLNARGA
jgi:nicotinamide-nucleotide amidase